MSILLNITHIKATGIFLVISEPTEFSKMPFLSLARTPFQRQGKSPISVSHCCLLIVPGSGDFPGGPVAETPHSQCREPRFNPSQGRARMPQLKVPHAAVKMKTLCAQTKPWHSQEELTFTRGKAPQSGNGMSKPMPSAT